MQTRARKQGCPVDAAMAVIEGRWKSTILCLLARSGGMRFSEMRKSIGNVTARILAKQLKELVEDGMVVKDPAEGRNNGAYRITEKGLSICPILIELARWGLEHQMVDVVVPEDQEPGSGGPAESARRRPQTHSIRNRYAIRHPGIGWRTVSTWHTTLY